MAPFQRLKVVVATRLRQLFELRIHSSRLILQVCPGLPVEEGEEVSCPPLLRMMRLILMVVSMKGEGGWIRETGMDGFSFVCTKEFAIPVHRYVMK